MGNRLIDINTVQLGNIWCDWLLWCSRVRQVDLLRPRRLPL